MITNVSILSSIYFFPHNVAYDGNTFDLCASKATFNTEDKNGAVKDFKAYIHRLVKTDEVRVGIVASPVSDTDYTLQVHDSDGNVVSSTAFTNLAGTNFHEVTVPIAGLMDYAKYFFIVADAVEETTFAVSDLHMLWPSVPKLSKTILHSNDGTSIDYANAKYNSSFQNRFTAVFHRPQYPEDLETDRNSSGTPVLLSSAVRTQRQIRLLHAPGYIHHKLKVILKSYVLTIESKNYKQEEAYEMKWVNEDHEFASGSVFLTEVNNITRNLYKV